MLPYCSGIAKSISDKNPISVDFVTTTRQFFDKLVPLSASQKSLRHHIALACGRPRQQFSFNTDACQPACQHRPACTSQGQRCPYRVHCACTCKNLSGASELVIQSAQRRCTALAPNRAFPLTPARSERGNRRTLVPINANNRPPDGCLSPTPNHTRFYASQAQVT